MSRKNGRHKLPRHTPEPKSPVLVALEARLEKAERKLVEAVAYTDDLVSGWEREREDILNGGRLAGRLGARKDGNNWPYLRNMEDLITMRAASREACEGNGYGAGMLDRAVDFVIGDGMQPEVTLVGVKKGAVATGIADADGDGRPDADPAVENVMGVIEEFRRLNDWGMGAEDREEEGFRREQRDGEVFVRFFAAGDTNGIPLVRWVEPEQVEAPPGGSEWRWGIKYRKINGVPDVESKEAVYVRTPDGTDGDWVPMTEVVYHKLGTDRTVLRGMPQFWLVARALYQSDALNSALSEVSAIQAKIAYVREHAPGIMPGQITDFVGGTLDGNGVKRTVYGDRYRRTGIQEEGTTVDMSAGMKFTAGPASTGVPAFVQALQSRLRQVCARFGYPEFFTGDASNNNYASSLTAGGPAEKAFKRKQHKYAAFQAAVYRRACEYAVADNRLSAADLAAVEIKVKASSVTIANKLEEAQVQQIRIQNKTLSPQTAMVENGHDPKVEMANIKAFDDEFGMGAMGMGAMGMGDGGGGGGFDGGQLLEPTGESYTQAEYQLLTESQKSLLVKKTGTDSKGRPYTRWVSADADVGGKADASMQRAQMLEPGPGVGGKSGDRKAETDAPQPAAKTRDQLDYLPKDPKRLTIDQATQGLTDLGYTEIEWGTEAMGVTGPDGKRQSLPHAQVKRLLYGEQAVPKASRMNMDALSRAYKQAGGGAVLGPAKGEPYNKPKAYRVRTPDGGETVVAAGEILKAVVAAGLARESYREDQYQLLSEADRSRLVRKTITNSRGRKQVVWVRAMGDERDAGTQTRQQVADARALVAKAVADPNSLNPEQFKALAAHLETVNRDEIRNLLKQVGEKVGGQKVELANRLVEKVKAGRTGGVGDALARGDTPQPNPRIPANAVDNPATVGNNTPVQPQSAGANQGGGGMQSTSKPSAPKISARDAVQKANAMWDNLFSTYPRAEDVSRLRADVAELLAGQSAAALNKIGDKFLAGIRVRSADTVAAKIKQIEYSIVNRHNTRFRSDI